LIYLLVCTKMVRVCRKMPTKRWYSSWLLAHQKPTGERDSFITMTSQRTWATRQFITSSRSMQDVYFQWCTSPVCICGALAFHKTRSELYSSLNRVPKHQKTR